MMGMHRPTISEMEAGNRKISAEELTKLADLYDTKIVWLLGEAPTALLMMIPSCNLLLGNSASSSRMTLTAF